MEKPPELYLNLVEGGSLKKWACLVLLRWATKKALPQIMH
jgi:hypothetical protein